jgi:hypothetical protein
MAGSTAEINWTSNDAQVLRTFQKVERGFDEIARRMDRVEKASNRAAQSAAGGWDKVIGSLRSTAAALIGGGSVLTAINMVSEANRKALEDAQNAAKEYDRLFRGFRIQAGLGAIEAEQAKNKIIAIGKANAVKEDVATAAAKELVGSGFAVDQATGPALQAFLKVRSAMDQQNGGAAEAGQLAGAMASYLFSQGLDKNAGNVERVGRDFFALYAKGKLQFPDFGEISKEGATFAGKLNPEEQFSAYSVLRDANLAGPEAATGLRNIVLRLSTAGAPNDRTRTDALQRLGLKPGDVDLVGESFGEAMTKIRDKLAGVPAKDRDSLLKMLFEEAGVSPAKMLMERMPMYAERISDQTAPGVPAAMGEAAQTAQSGRVAAGVRLGVKNNVARAANDAADDLVLQAIEAQYTEMDRNAVDKWVSKKVYSGLRATGFVSQEGALRFINPSGDPLFAERVLKGVQDAAGGEKVAPLFETPESIEKRKQAEFAAAQNDADIEEARQEFYAERNLIAPDGSIGDPNGWERSRPWARPGVRERLLSQARGRRSGDTGGFAANEMESASFFLNRGAAHEESALMRQNNQLLGKIADGVRAPVEAPRVRDLPQQSFGR